MSLICNAINNIVINIIIITVTLLDNVTVVVIFAVTVDSCFITIYCYLVTWILADANCDIPVYYITYLYCYYFFNFYFDFVSLFLFRLAFNALHPPERYGTL